MSKVMKISVDSSFWKHQSILLGHLQFYMLSFFSSTYSWAELFLICTSMYEQEILSWL